jgi:hypothetical protein
MKEKEVDGICSMHEGNEKYGLDSIHLAQDRVQYYEHDSEMSNSINGVTFLG